MIPTIDNKLKLQNYCFFVTASFQHMHLVVNSVALLFWLIKGEILPTTLKWDSLFEKEVFKRRPTFELFFVVFWKNRKSICLNLAVGVKKIQSIHEELHSIPLIFLNKKSEIWNDFTIFEKWKVKKKFPSLFSRSESENQITQNRDREVKVKIKWLKIESRS